MYIRIRVHDCLKFNVHIHIHNKIRYEEEDDDGGAAFDALVLLELTLVLN